MKLDTVLAATDLEAVTPAAKFAEEMGFGALWAPETTATPYLPLGVAALATETIELGTAIAVAFPRSPMITAMDSWAIQKASHGRFILGLGTQVKGHNERRFSVPFEHPGPKLREMIEAIRHIWRSFQGEEKLAFDGEFYKFNLMTPFFNSGPIADPEIPIYIAGVNEYMCNLAGELCEGFHVHPFHSVKYLRETVLPAIDRGLETAGRKRSEISLVSPVFVCIGENEEEIEAAKGPVRMQLAFYGSTRTYQPVFAAHGWEETTAKLQKLMSEGRMAEMGAAITDEMLDEFALSCTYEDAAEKIIGKYEGLIDRAFFYLPISVGLAPEQEKRWRSIIEAINS